MMHRYLYNYLTTVDFSSPVTHHQILLRCQPMRCRSQHIEDEHVVISPDFHIQEGKDVFGNRIIYGGAAESHISLTYVSTGIIRVEEDATGESNIPFFYRIPSALTFPSEQIKDMALAAKGGNFDERMLRLCCGVHEALLYEKGATHIETTADKALLTGKGVCADYSHVMIAASRLAGYPARYVSGFLEGTGETHAWVEVHDGYKWHSFDPTHACRAQRGYVKLAHGRDAMDCSVNRGTFIGNVSESTLVNVILKEI